MAAEHGGRQLCFRRAAAANFEGFRFFFVERVLRRIVTGPPPRRDIRLRTPRSMRDAPLRNPDRRREPNRESVHARTQLVPLCARQQAALPKYPRGQPTLKTEQMLMESTKVRKWNCEK